MCLNIFSVTCPIWLPLFIFVIATDLLINKPDFKRGQDLNPRPQTMVRVVSPLHSLLDLVSISSTFYAQIFHTNFSPKPKRIQKKLPKQRLYEKCVHKMLMKLTPGGFLSRMMFVESQFLTQLIDIVTRKVKPRYTNQHASLILYEIL